MGTHGVNAHRTQECEWHAVVWVLGRMVILLAGLVRRWCRCGNARRTMPHAEMPSAGKVDLAFGVGSRDWKMLASR